MRISRREFLKAAAAATVAGKLTPAAFADLQRMMRGEGDPRVIWLQGAGCDGCAVSFLNSVHYATVDDLLVNTLDVEFQSKVELTWSAAPGASIHQVLRGLISHLPVGSGAPSEECTTVLGVSMIDNDPLSPGSGFWYLPRGRNDCGGGTYGEELPPVERVSPTCP